jgi:hypothetical protein
MRAETGSMKFGQDWTGVFIRGDDCMAYQMYLRPVLDFFDKEMKRLSEAYPDLKPENLSERDQQLVNAWYQIGELRGLGELLCSSKERANSDVQVLKDWSEVQIKNVNVSLPTLNMSSKNG